MVTRLSKPVTAAYGLLSLIVVLVLFALLFVEPGSRLGFVLLGLVFTGVGIANALIPGVKATVQKIFKAYFLFLFWLILLTGPLTLFRALSNALLASTSTLVRLLVLTTWGLLLVFASALVMYEKTRERIFRRLRALGVLAPLAYSLNLLFISIQFFAVATFLLYQAGSVSLSLGSATVVSSDTATEFFMWHFLGAIPLLDVNATLLWEAPLIYVQSGVGWILLAFKITVIIPVIAAFGWWWQFLNKTGDEPPAATVF